MTNANLELQELINEYFAAKATADAARSLVEEFMNKNGVENATAENGSVSYRKGYENRPVFDSKRFAKENPETAAAYVKYENRRGGYIFKSA